MEIAGKLLGFLADGYTVTGVLKHGVNAFGQPVELAVPIRFVYRPVGAGEFQEYVDAMSRLQQVDEAGVGKLQVELAVKHIESWDCKTPHGKPVPVSEESIRNLAPQVFTRILNILRGQDGPDEGGINLGDEQKN